MSAELQPPIRIVIVEDEPFFRDLLTARFSQSTHVQVIGSFGTAEEAFAQIPALQPDVLLTDLMLGGSMNGLQLGLALRPMLPNLGICVLTSHLKPDAMRQVPPSEMKGLAYLVKQTVKNIGVLERTIIGVAEGMVILVPDIANMPPLGNQSATPLTPRELDVLKAMAEGLSNEAIGQRLGLTDKTVANYTNVIFRKVAGDVTAPGAQPRVQAVLYYLRELAAKT